MYFKPLQEASDIFVQIHPYHELAMTDPSYAKDIEETMAKYESITAKLRSWIPCNMPADFHNLLATRDQALKWFQLQELDLDGLGQCVGNHTIAYRFCDLWSKATGKAIDVPVCTQQQFHIADVLDELMPRTPTAPSASPEPAPTRPTVVITPIEVPAQEETIESVVALLRASFADADDALIALSS